jgi:hypothetical protein
MDKIDECHLLGRYAMWLFLQEPYGVIFQKTTFFMVTAMKTSYLTRTKLIFFNRFQYQMSHVSMKQASFILEWFCITPWFRQ